MREVTHASALRVVLLGLQVVPCCPLSFAPGCCWGLVVFGSPMAARMGYVQRSDWSRRFRHKCCRVVMFRYPVWVGLQERAYVDVDLCCGAGWKRLRAVGTRLLITCIDHRWSCALGAYGAGEMDLCWMDDGAAG